MVKVIQHPSSPVPSKGPAAEPEVDYEPSALEIETAVLIGMLKDEIGLRRMSFPLRLQMEKVELLL